MLVFGSSAMMGAFKWIVLVGGGPLLVYAILTFAAFLIHKSIKALVEAKVEERKAFIWTLTVLALMCVLPAVGGYILLLWLGGNPERVPECSSPWNLQTVSVPFLS